MGPAVPTLLRRIAVTASNIASATPATTVDDPSNSIVGALSIHSWTSASASPNPALFMRKIAWPLPNCKRRSCSDACLNSS